MNGHSSITPPRTSISSIAGAHRVGMPSAPAAARVAHGVDGLSAAAAKIQPSALGAISHQLMAPIRGDMRPLARDCDRG